MSAGAAAAAAAALCLGSFPAGVEARIPSATATLAWVHSVEKVRWEETWRAEGGRLVAVEARVQGGGAGMEPPPDAALRDGWFVYRPAIGPLERISLSRRGFAQDYELCWDGACRPMADLAPPGPDGTTDLFPCPAG